MKNILSHRLVLCQGKHSVLLPLLLAIMVFAGFLCCQSAYGQNTTKKRTEPLSLVQLIAGSESMTRPGERLKWIEQLPLMTVEKREKLRAICETERSKLADINRSIGAKPAPVPKLHGVRVRNRTASQLEIMVPGYWFDENGEKRKRNSTWSFSPKESASLLAGKERVYASKFLYQVRMNNRTYPSEGECWVAYYSPGQGTIVQLNPQDFAPNRHVAAKPVINGGRSNADQLFDQFIQLAEDVNDIAEAYDENVKPVVSAIKKARAKNAYRVYLESIDVAARKSNGKHWDSGKGAPDLIVRLKVKTFGGDSFKASVVKNSYFNTYDEMSVRAKPGQTIEISVYDDDAFSNDFVGSYRLDITKDLLKRGQTDLSFGQVESLVLRFEK